MSAFGQKQTFYTQALITLEIIVANRAALGWKAVGPPEGQHIEFAYHSFKMSALAELREFRQPDAIKIKIFMCYSIIVPERDRHRLYLTHVYVLAFDPSIECL